MQKEHTFKFRSVNVMLPQQTVRDIGCAN
jgi:hypothetical protein